jgi:predicted nucleic acid-binding protein
MAPKPKIFLETTVFNFHSEAKEGKKRRDTIALFEAIAAGCYEPFTSNEVVEELKGSVKFPAMSKLIDDYGVTTLKKTAEIERLADIYIAEKVIPQKFRDDAVHIATAVVNHLDFVVSFNFGHIAKPKTNVATNFVNLDEGYAKVIVCNPSEVIDYDTRRKDRAGH